MYFVLCLRNKKSCTIAKAKAKKKTELNCVEINQTIVWGKRNRLWLNSLTFFFSFSLISYSFAYFCIISSSGFFHNIRYFLLHSSHNVLGITHKVKNPTQCWYPNEQKQQKKSRSIATKIVKVLLNVGLIV